MKDTDLAKIFGDNLSDIIHANRTSQRKLALQLGISDQAVSNWTRGLKIPRYEVLYKAMEILNCTPNDLIPYPDLKNNNKDNDNVTRNDVYKIAILLQYLLDENISETELRNIIKIQKALRTSEPAIRDAIYRLLELD